MKNLLTSLYKRHLNFVFHVPIETVVGIFMLLMGAIIPFEPTDHIIDWIALRTIWTKELWIIAFLVCGTLLVILRRNNERWWNTLLIMPAIMFFWYVFVWLNRSQNIYRDSRVTDLLLIWLAVLTYISFVKSNYIKTITDLYIKEKQEKELLTHRIETMGEGNGKL